LATDLAFALQAIEELAIPTAQVQHTRAGLYLARDDFILPAAMAAQAGMGSAIARARKLNYLGDAPFEKARRQAFHLPLGKQFGVDTGIVWQRHGF
jgi:hypothetical protein